MARRPHNGLPPAGHVSNDLLRETFLSSEWTAHALGRELGYLRKRNDAHLIGDDSPVRRALGLKGYSSNGKARPPQRFMKEATALRYAKVLRVDPHELDL